MASTARPRRSAANAVSYANLFAALSSSSSSASSDASSDSEGSGGDASPGQRRASTGKSKGKGKGKGKGKVRAMSDDNDTGSEFAIEEADAEEEDVDEADLVASDDDSGAKSEPERSDDGSVGGSSISGSNGRIHRRVLKPVVPKTRVATIRALTKKHQVESKRAQPSPIKRPSLMDTHWMHIGTAYEPPHRALDDKADAPWKIGTEEEQGLDDEMQSRWLEAWALHPFGIEKSLVRDNAWEKGKWTDKGMSSRWGGWYDVRAATQPVPQKDRHPYLPHLVYPSRPAKIYLHRKLATEQGDEADEAATSMEEDEVVLDDDQEDEDEGVKIWIGSLHDQNEQQLVQFKRFESHRLDEFLPNKPGHVLNAGGPVSGLAWWPRPDPAPLIEYLAVSCFCSATATLKMTKTPGASMLQFWSLDTSDPGDISLATSKSSQAQMKLEMALCIEEGDAWELAWCPRGGDRAKMMDDEGGDSLGLLAGSFEDGSVSVYAVPDPVKARKTSRIKAGEPAYLKAKPVLRLTLADTKCTCFAWVSHETIVAGCNNGWVAVWSVGDALRSGDSTVRPIKYFNAHFTIIRSIVVIRTPPLSTALDGSFDVDAEPTAVVTTGYDGSVFMTDLRDLSLINSMHHERHAGLAIAYCSQTGLLLNDDPEGRVRASILKPNNFGSRVWILSHSGPIWSINTSSHHPFVASTSADGVVSIANSVRPLRDRLLKGHYAQKVYRIDFSRKSGEYRMVDNILPEARPTADTHKLKVLHRGSTSTASWSPEIGVARAAWHPALDRCALLASGMMCGLVRVDWCEGGKSVA